MLKQRRRNMNMYVFADISTLYALGDLWVVPHSNHALVGIYIINFNFYAQFNN